MAETLRPVAIDVMAMPEVATILVPLLSEEQREANDPGAVRLVLMSPAMAIYLVNSGLADEVIRNPSQTAWSRHRSLRADRVASFQNVPGYP